MDTEKGIFLEVGKPNKGKKGRVQNLAREQLQGTFENADFNKGGFKTRSRKTTSQMNKLLQERMENRSEETYKRIVEAYSQLVNKIVGAQLMGYSISYNLDSIDYNDLIQEGYIGVMEALQKYEGNELKFRKDLKFCIRNRIWDYIKKNSVIVKLDKIPISMTQYEEYIQKFIKEHGREPSLPELEEKFYDKLPHNEPYIHTMSDCYNALETYKNTPVKIDNELKPEDYKDIFIGVDEADIGLEGESVSTDLDRALQILTPREKDIIKRSFGIGCQEMTDEEIGEMYNLTKNRVIQMKETAIRKLQRTSCSKKLLKKYLG